MWQTTLQETEETESVYDPSDGLHFVKYPEAPKPSKQRKANSQVASRCAVL